MGRATIAGGGTAGLYNVTVDYGAATIAAQVAVIDQQIADRQADLADAVAAVAATDAAFTTAVTAADAAIDLYAADPTDERRQAMNAAAQELARISGERRVAEARRASLATIILSLQADKAQLQAVRTSETRAAWCVDYTEDATGEVATIEVPGEVGTLVIAPGGRAPTAADGKLVARGAQVSYQAYYNAAILPGWQRFVHPYRVGTLTAKSGNVGAVLMDAATSSAAGLQVRDEQAVNVGIEYMTCDGDAFQVGDRVVVDTRGPTVIGFESNPRMCPNEYLRTFQLTVSTPVGQGVALLYPGPATITQAQCSAVGVQGNPGTYATFLALTTSWNGDAINPPTPQYTYNALQGTYEVVSQSGFGQELPFDRNRLTTAVSGAPVSTSKGNAYPAVDFNVIIRETLGVFATTGSGDGQFRACLGQELASPIWSPSITTADIPKMSINASAYRAVGFTDARMDQFNPRRAFIDVVFEPDV